MITAREAYEQRMLKEIECSVELTNTFNKIQDKIKKACSKCKHRILLYDYQESDVKYKIKSVMEFYGYRVTLYYYCQKKECRCIEIAWYNP